MASYQMKQRDPLFDTNMQAAITRRGHELLGIGLLVLGVLVAMMLGSYVPDDPSWLVATDEPAQNWLGRPGALIASPLIVIMGLGAWGLAVVLAAWGLRFVLHRGEERCVGRIVFAPIAIAMIAIYAATLTPGSDWLADYGLGGRFGDTVLGAVLNIVPVSTVFGLKLIAFATFFVAIALTFFVTGFDRREMGQLGRFLLVGLIMAYAQLMVLMGRGASGAVQGVRQMQARQQTRKEEANVAQAAHVREPLVHRAEAPVAEEPIIEEPRPSILSRMPSLLNRTPEPELIEPTLPENALEADAPTDERIKARIADVVRNRARTPAPGFSGRAEPPLQANVGPEPEASAIAAAIAKRRGPDPLIAAKQEPRMAPPPQPLDAEPEVLELSPDQEIAPLIDEEPPQAPKPMFQHRSVVQHSKAKKILQPSRRAQQEAQPALQFEETPQVYENPPLSLLTNHVSIERHHLSDEALEENARMLETVLDDYGIKGEIVSVRPGPVVTMYELEPAPGLKASRVIGLADDIARSMSALSARVSTVPGRSVIGIELPNANREKVVLREILASSAFGDNNMRLPLALGKDIGGDPIVANLAKMPHLLIAGTTGSGKSVAINTMILSLLYRLTPEECRVIMIDPKMLELSVYDGIPHLLSPVVTDPKKAVVALKWVVGEMEERYRKMSKMGVRNIEGYNGRVRDAIAKGEMFSRTVQTGFDEDTGEPIFETEEFAPEAIPYIVVIVDEMADLMMVAGKEIEACIQRLAQMARASGIHLIMATQRPSVDVITGTIKANFPTRISFQVTSKIDSRTILGEQGAEQLLGMGDMLYMAGGAKITRVHGPFVSDEEVEEIVNYLKAFGPPEYMSGVVDGPDSEKESDIDAVLGLGGNTDAEDALYDTAVAIVLKDRKCSTSYIQRKLAIGYNKAARLVEQMEENHVVSPANHVGKREILVPEQ
ncbi:cell division protein FtsK [Actibacterium atlanticum]|uniref:DNA translocase FtsK n=1 Tax=Actibacterium atlanticum TaxID=1461693 RepID=A0A058ZNK2_9RHOB|nr:DNA translocase FtsK 4TM domain-containing protein [Actibacterium atlanticum]KCV82401.1 cell division protein FtsK [Actibacterium atlanticum]